MHARYRGFIINSFLNVTRVGIELEFVKNVSFDESQFPDHELMFWVALFQLCLLHLSGNCPQQPCQIAVDSNRTIYDRVGLDLTFQFLVFFRIISAGF